MRGMREMEGPATMDPIFFGYKFVSYEALVRRRNRRDREDYQNPDEEALVSLGMEAEAMPV